MSKPDEIKRTLLDAHLNYRASVRRLDQNVLPRLEEVFRRLTLEQFRETYDHEHICAWMSNKEVSAPSASLQDGHPSISLEFLSNLFADQKPRDASGDASSHFLRRTKPRQRT